MVKINLIGFAVGWGVTVALILWFKNPFSSMTFSAFVDTLLPAFFCGMVWMGVLAICTNIAYYTGLREKTDSHPDMDQSPTGPSGEVR
jgi:hypothetical protein